MQKCGTSFLRVAELMGTFTLSGRLLGRVFLTLLRTGWDGCEEEGTGHPAAGPRPRQLIQVEVSR